MVNNATGKDLGDHPIKILYAMALTLMCLGHFFYNGNVITCILCMLFLPLLLFAFGYEAADSLKGNGSKVKTLLLSLKESFFRFLLPTLLLNAFSPIVDAARDWQTYSPLDAVKSYFNCLIWGYGYDERSYGQIGLLFVLLTVFLISILYAIIRVLTGKIPAFIISVLVSVAGYILAWKQIGLPFSLNAALPCFVFYGAGAFFAEYKEFFFRSKFIFIGASVPAMAFCTYKGFYFFPESGLYATVFSYLNAFAGVILSVALAYGISFITSRYIKPAAKVLGLLGAFPVTFIGVHFLDGYLGRYWGITDYMPLNFLIRFAEITLLTLLIGTVFKREDYVIKPEGKLKTAVNVIFYVLFALTYGYRFFHTTMFPMLVREWKTIDRVYDALVFLIILSALLSIAGVEKRLYRFAAFAMVIISLIQLSRGGYYEVFVMMLLVVASIGKDFKPILIISVIIGSLMMILAYQASMHGYIPYLVYDTGGEYGSHAFGIVYRTDFAAHVLYLAMSYAALRKEKITTIGYMVLVFSTWFVWRYVHARMNTFCMILFLVGYAVFILLALFGKKLKIPKWFCIAHGVGYIGAVAGSLILGGSSVNIGGLDTGSLWARFQMSKQAILENGIHLFGRTIYERGAGGITDGSNPYFFLDITYIRNLVIHGLLISIIYLVVMTVASYRASKEGHTVIAGALLLVAIVSMIEHHATEISYNVFMFAAFANMGWKEGSPKWITKFKQSFSRRTKGT